MVAGFDVVGRLAEHQQNLVPTTRPQRSALLALPVPPLCLALHADLFRRRRATALAELAAELGGGDGPLPVTDLEADGRPLDEVLEQLRDDGVEWLWTYGDTDQPGFARAVSFRWPGALATWRGRPPGLLAALLDDPAPARWLAADVVRVAPGYPIPAQAEHCVVLLGHDADADPRHPAVPAPPGADVRSYACDPSRAAGAHTGFVPRRACFGTELGNACRERWRHYWSERGQAEAVRCAVLGLDPLLERRLRHPRRGPHRDHGARIVAVTGMDGAGKSTHVAELRRHLTGLGYRTGALKIYRQGAFLQLADELSGRTRRGAPLQTFRLSRLVKLIDSLRTYRDQLAPRAARCDVLLMDRYVDTHRAAALAQLGWDLTDHPLLAVFPAPDLLAWLRLPAAHAIARLESRGEPRSADEHPAGLEGYADAFEALLGSDPRHLVLDASEPFERNARTLAERAARALPPPQGDGGSALDDPPAAAPARPEDDSLRCRVVLGLGDDQPVLGADVLALRRLLENELGPVAAGIPEALWLEAYATQAVLDLRTDAPEHAYLPLWPRALAAAFGAGDLLGLPDLEAMLLPHIEVVAYRPGDAPWLGTLARGRAAVRVETAYRDALARCAARAGWRAVV